MCICKALTPKMGKGWHLLCTGDFRSKHLLTTGLLRGVCLKEDVVQLNATDDEVGVS